MSKTTRLFSSVPVEQQKASSFDMTHYSCGSAKCGQLIPIFKQDIIPGDLISLGIMSQIDLPPMATAFMGRIDMRYEAFFVPNRIVWGGWEHFITKPTDDPYAPVNSVPHYLPCIATGTLISDDALFSMLGRSSLADYLGFRQDATTRQELVHSSGIAGGRKDIVVDNALPFLAYHKIYDDWYRNAQLSVPLFQRIAPTQNTPLSNYPWAYFDDSKNFAPVIGMPMSNTGSGEFANGDDILTIHQRCWADDRFTTLALYPQAAISPAVVENKVTQNEDKDVLSSTFSIPNLRAANIAQRYREIMNLAGERYPDQLFAEYGVRPADAILDRPLFLGSYSHGVYTSAIMQNTATDKGNEKNPFSNELGSSAGDASGFGKDSLISGFKATEHGYVIVIASLVPHAFYSNGIDGDLLQSQIGDIASPKLQGLGEQPVYREEVMGAYNTISSDPYFGYSPQYSRYKYRNDEIHGELRDTPHQPVAIGSGSLRYFVLQRTLENSNQILDTSFVEIPITFLDQCFSVTTAASGYSYMWYIQWQLKMTRPLAEYSIPTLGDPKDTYTTRIPLRGRQIKG